MPMVLWALLKERCATMFKEDRKFKLKQQTLKWEVFKHCRHFTGRDFGVLAQHLIGGNSRADNTVPQGIRGAHEIPSAQQPCAHGLG